MKRPQHTDTWTCTHKKVHLYFAHLILEACKVFSELLDALFAVVDQRQAMGKVAPLLLVCCRAEAVAELLNETFTLFVLLSCRMKEVNLFSGFDSIFSKHTKRGRTEKRWTKSNSIHKGKFRGNWGKMWKEEREGKKRRQNDRIANKDRRNNWQKMKQQTNLVDESEEVVHDVAELFCIHSCKVWANCEKKNEQMCLNKTMKNNRLGAWKRLKKAGDEKECHLVHDGYVYSSTIRHKFSLKVYLMRHRTLDW